MEEAAPVSLRQCDRRQAGIHMLPCSYLEQDTEATERCAEYGQGLESEDGKIAGQRRRRGAGPGYRSWFRTTESAGTTMMLWFTLLFVWPRGPGLVRQIVLARDDSLAVGRGPLQLYTKRGRLHVAVSPLAGTAGGCVSRRPSACG